MYEPSDLLNHQLALLTTQLNDGFSAYENATNILKYYNSHGYTEHFRELIGNESIIEGAREAIGRFYEWLKRKITEIIQKIKQFFHNLKVRICRFLGIKVNDTTSPDDTKTLTQITKSLRIISDKTPVGSCIDASSGHSIKLPYGCSSSGRTLTIVWDLKAIRETAVQLYSVGTESYEAYSESAVLLNYFKNLCEPDPSKAYTYSLMDIKTLATHVHTLAINTITHCNTVTNMLTKFESIVKQCSVSASMSEEDKRATIDKALNDFLVTSARINRSYVTRNDKDQFNTQACINRLTQYITIKTTFVNTAFAWIMRLDRVYNASSNAVHLKYKIDSEFAKDLQTFIANYYHLSYSAFNPRYMYVTNVAPETWLDETVPAEEIGTGEYDSSRFPTAWTGVNSGQSGANDCYVSYRAYHKVFESDKIDPESKGVMNLMSSIVHECTHLFDAQNGREFKYQIKYTERPQEISARYVSKEFNASPHMRWLCDVIRDVRSKVAKH